MNNQIKLKILDVYITGNCNFKCEYCYGESDNCGSMCPNTYLKTLEFAQYLQAEYIQLCGGEPLVCPEFERNVILAKEKNLKVILRTNGILINNHLKFIAHNCSWVGISIDGLPEENRLMRPPRFEISVFKQFHQPIDSIFELKKENPRIYIILATLASSKNWQSIPMFAKYLQQNKVPIDKWKIYEFIKDKFRSAANSAAFEMEEPDFKKLGNLLPNDINGAPIQLQSSHTERVSANCLIVYQNGDINLMGKHYGNINVNSFDSIVNALLADNALCVIEKNKETTYAK